jgi:AraC-like DNA-binding protein
MDWRALKAQTIIRTEHGTPGLNLRKISGRFGISAPHLGKLFLKSLNVSFHQRLLQVRMEHSHMLLSEANLTLDAVAHRVGYTDTSNFCRAFKAYFGASPRRFYHKEQIALLLLRST